MEDEQLVRDKLGKEREVMERNLKKRREAQRAKRGQRREEQEMHELDVNRIMADADAASGEFDERTEEEMQRRRKRLEARLNERAVGDIMDTGDDPNNIYNFFDSNAEKIQCGNSESGVLNCLEINAEKKNLDYISVTYNAPNTFNGNRNLEWKIYNNNTQKKQVTEDTKEVTYFPANAWKSSPPLVYFEDSERNYRKVPLKDVKQIETHSRGRGGKRKRKQNVKINVRRKLNVKAHK